MLLGCGILRLGILANFLSHTVVQAFITASAIIIAVSQFKHLMGVNSGGDNLLELLSALIENVGQTNIYTFALGLAVIALSPQLAVTGELAFSGDSVFQLHTVPTSW